MMRALTVAMTLRRATAKGRHHGDRRPSEARCRAPERCCTLTISTHRGIRLPLGLPYERARRARRGDRLAVRSELRRAERLRHAARSRGRLLPARTVRHQRAVLA